VKTTIYYFSGTGNSLQVARDLAQQMGETIIKPIRNNMEEDFFSETVGIVFPVYLWGVPEMVLKFADKLKENHAVRYIFAIATYKSDAGDAIGQLRRKMNKIGAKLSAGFTIAMPGNNIIFYDVESKQAQANKLNACGVKLGEIAQVIRDRQVTLPAVSVIDRLLKTGLLHHILVSTFKNSDKRFRIEPACNGCGSCSKVCPAGNIELKSGRPVWKHNCQQCLACINLCPNQAIQYGNITAGRQRYRNPVVDIREFDT